MLLHPEERQKHNLDHARWRVSFILSLLQAHRKLLRRRNDEWQARETEYVQQLAAAQTELDHAETELRCGQDAVPNGRIVSRHNLEAREGRKDRSTEPKNDRAIEG